MATPYLQRRPRLSARTIPALRLPNQVKLPPIELSAFGMGQRPDADHTAFINTERT